MKTPDADLADILAADNPEVWSGNPPAKGGDTGTMFKRIIERALEIREENAAASPAAKASAAREDSAKPAATRATKAASAKSGSAKSAAPKSATKSAAKSRKKR